MKKRIINLLNVGFCLLCFVIFLGGMLKSILKPDDIMIQENRTANKYAKFTIDKYLSSEFQNNIEQVLSDQIILAETMKNSYNFYNSNFKIYLNNIIFKDGCGKYIPLSNDVFSFGCDGTLVSTSNNLSTGIDLLDSRIKLFNELIESNPKTSIYAYMVERDRDINFETKTKNNVYEYFRDNVNIKKSNIARLSIDSFFEYQKYFYKIDHHWNYEGSKKGYEDIAKLLEPNSPNIISPDELICYDAKFGGSKSMGAGVQDIYKEKFCAYHYNLPNEKFVINNKHGWLGYEMNQYKDFSYVTYGNFYGSDSGLIQITIDNNKGKDNLLIVSDSFSNAITTKIATNFYNTYDIDLRA
ncbi:MAG: DHHW family protein, partial [Clostridia bacterium]